MKNKIALITGKTCGIGVATAYEFAKHGINLVLCRQCIADLLVFPKAQASSTIVKKEF